MKQLRSALILKDRPTTLENLNGFARKNNSFEHCHELVSSKQTFRNVRDHITKSPVSKSFWILQTARYVTRRYFQSKEMSDRVDGTIV